jgi:hypothetical protein
MDTAAGKPALEDNRIRPEDRAVHDWYRFVLSFPPHLVRTYLDRFGIGPGQSVLDPFCGTGTTLVECKKLGIASVGLERNPMAAFACRIKLDWDAAPERLLAHATQLAASVRAGLKLEGIDDDLSRPLFARTSGNGFTKLRDLPAAAKALLLRDSISPLPLHKTLALLDAIEKSGDPSFCGHEKLALASVAVSDASNLAFGPEVGVGRPKADAAVIAPWLGAVGGIASDLGEMRHRESVPATVRLADARDLSAALTPNSIDAVITSPPYPNEKDYTRTTRLESVILGLICNKAELRTLKQELVRSNTRSVYKSDEDDRIVADNREIQRIAAAIEQRRIELGKTSGFERLYARVTRLYFGGMARHLANLRSCLRPGARLAYVVGDQASYLRVMIRTGTILAGLAQDLGYRVEGIDLFRTRRATATRAALREEVVILCWPKEGSRTTRR